MCIKYARVVVACVLLLSVSMSTGQETGDTPRQEIEKLRKQLAELQQTVARMQAQLPDSSAGVAQDELEAELARELGMTSPGAEASAQPQQGIRQEPPSTRRSLFQNMNPNISVIGTVLGSGTLRDSERRNVDLVFKEGEFSFQSVVDPYARADFFIAFGQETDSGLSPTGVAEAEEEGGLQAEIEEAYITILSLPFALQLKAGKFRSKFGKINETHPHAYNFVNLPLMVTYYFGQEGLNDDGASLSWLVPNGKFFQELTVQATSGPAENASFGRAADNHLLYLAHLKNMFDLNDNTTLELGFSGLTGPNGAEGKTTQILAADLTLKWKPVRFNRYKSFEFLSEFLLSKRNGTAGDVTSFGLYAFLRYQLSRRWFLAGMVDYSQFPQFDNFHHQAFSGILQFFTTEFQKFEVQYRYNTGNFFDSFSDFRVRAVFVIGAHGAHQY